MSIDLINNSTAPPRVSQPDVAAVAARQARQPVAEGQGKVAEAKKEAQANEKQVQNAPDKLEVKKAVEQLADFVSARQSQISFSIDESSGSQIVKIMDSESKQVIRQFPSEEAVAIARALDKLQGLLIKDKA